MTAPGKVEIAFGIDPFDATALAIGGNWVDVTSYVREASYTTSTRSDRFAVFAAGSAQIVLDARDREMDPSYVSSSYVNDFRRSTPVRISGTHSSTDYVQFFGYARLWTPRYAAKDAVTVLDATDGLGLLARYSLAPITAAHGGDTCATRIGRVLDDIGFPSGATWRDLDIGNARLLETTFGVNALQHIALVAASDAGFFYAQRDGVLTFDDQASLTDTRQQTSQATLSHDTAPKYLVDSLERTGIGEGFRNLVRIGGSGVDVQEVDNTAANDAPVVYQRTDLLMNSTGRAAAMADFYADLYGTETPNTSKVTYLVSASSDTAYNSELFVRKIRDRVTVEFDPPGAGADLSDQVFIDGMSGSLTPDLYSITYTLSSADAYDDNLASAPSTWLVLDSTSQGTLNTNRLGY